MTLHCTARFVTKGTAEHRALRSHYLTGHPKAKLYVDFPDFSFVRFDVTHGLLNAGFGKAFRVAPQDVAPPPDQS